MNCQLTGRSGSTALDRIKKKEQAVKIIGGHERTLFENLPNGSGHWIFVACGSTITCEVIRISQSSLIFGQQK